MVWNDNAGSVASLFSKHARSEAIDFGAEQVIIVRDQRAKERLQRCTNALVLTILEAKGLEFRDVLIVNFFQDSILGDNWRVAAALSQDANAGSVKGVQPFHATRHAALSSELKFLCT